MLTVNNKQNYAFLTVIHVIHLFLDIDDFLLSKLLILKKCIFT